MVHCLFHCRPCLKSQVWWWVETLVSLLLALPQWEPESRAGSVPREVQDLSPGQYHSGLWHWCEEVKAARAAKRTVWWESLLQVLDCRRGASHCLFCFTWRRVMRHFRWLYFHRITLNSGFVWFLDEHCDPCVPVPVLVLAFASVARISSSSSSCAWSWSLVGRCSLLGFDFCYLLEWFQPEMNFPVTIRG